MRHVIVVSGFQAARHPNSIAACQELVDFFHVSGKRHLYFHWFLRASGECARDSSADKM